MKWVALAGALLLCVALAPRAYAQTIDVDVGTASGGVSTYDLGSHPFSLDATLPSVGTVHERALGRDLGLGRYVLGGGGFSASVGVREWHVALGGGFFATGGGPVVGQIGAYYFGQSASVSGGYVDPQGLFRFALGRAGALELRPGVRIGGETITVPITGPTSACPVNCGAAVLHYDDAIVVPHVALTWLGGTYDHGTGFEVGIGVDIGVMVYPELGFQGIATLTMRIATRLEA